jgi:nucleoside triphosphatase
MRVFPNAWVMPGGHIESGETLEEALIREINEETGIEI